MTNELTDTTYDAEFRRKYTALGLDFTDPDAVFAAMYAADNNVGGAKGKAREKRIAEYAFLKRLLGADLWPAMDRFFGRPKRSHQPYQRNAA